MKVSDKDVCVYHLEYGQKYKPEILEAPIDLGMYFLCWRMPLDEFTESTMSGTISYLMAESRGPAWFGKGVRPILHGDVIWKCPYAYLLVPPEDTAKYAFIPPAIEIEDWPEYYAVPRTVEKNP